MTKLKVKVFADGASRGNGNTEAEAAIGIQIVDANGKQLDSHCERIGHATNNQAEYQALIKGLEMATKHTAGQVECHSDSQLVINQMNEKWKINNPSLKSLWIKAAGMENDFEKVTYLYLRRTDPRIAAVDALANEALDQDKELGRKP